MSAVLLRIEPGAAVNSRGGRSSDEKQKSKESTYRWRRRQAFQVLAQLPDDDDDALGILEEARSIIVTLNEPKPA